MSFRTIITAAGCLVLATAFWGSAEEAQTVSPGASDRFAEVAGRCPTFSWAEVAGATSYELVVYRVPEAETGSSPTLIELSDYDEVLFQKLPRGATGWTPERARCLEPGASFAWFVHGIQNEFGDEPIADGNWSAPRFFAVSLEPSIAEVEEALGVLRRYSTGSAGAPGSDFDLDAGTSGASLQATPAGMISGPVGGQKSVTTTATSSIRGEMLDPSGESYGVIGISNSSNGAGVGAGNTNNGPDLVLDGSEDNDPDAIFTQAGIDRPSQSADTMFFLLNSDEDHVLNLHVEGSVQVAADDGDGAIFSTDPANGDLHMQVFSSKMMIDIGGSTRVTIDNTGAVTIDGSTVTVEGTTLNLIGSNQLTLDAPNIDITASNSLQLEGFNLDIVATSKLDLDALTVDVGASTTTTITGALVKIN